MMKQTMSRRTEIIVKIPETIASVKTLCPFHPDVATPARDKNIPTLMINRIKMSIERSLGGGIVWREIFEKFEKMTTDAVI